MTMGPRTKSGEMRALGRVKCPACKPCEVCGLRPPCKICKDEGEVAVDVAIEWETQHRDTDPAPA